MEKLLSNQYGVFALAFVAFLVAAILVYVFVRTLLGGKLRLPGGRARQARLGIVDAFDLDRQRQLIIVRRDNTEHLIMIGGPNDLLIEAEIIRVEAREPRGRAGEPGFGDARIPAPYTPGDRPEIRGTGDSPAGDEPLLPISLPEVQPASPLTDPAVAAPPAPSRGPTFPLPPRRPVPAPLERRAPLPPRLPDGPGREAPTVGETPGTMPPAPDSAPINAPGEAPPPAAPLPTAPRPTLRPLPPRPPVRPLQRTTPRPPASGAAAPTPPPPVAPPPAEPPIVPGTVPPVAAIASPEPAAVTPPPPEAAAPPPAPEPAAAPPPPPPSAAPPPAAEPPAPPAAEDLSLEEEMAKLLGRN